jgi:hypothetical protein
MERGGGETQTHTQTPPHTQTRTHTRKHVPKITSVAYPFFSSFVCVCLRVGLGDGAEVEIRPFAGSHLGKDGAGAVLEKKNKKKETNAPWPCRHSS